MLDGLSRRDQGCVQHFFIVYFAGDLIGFLDDAIYCRTLDAFWLDAVHFEDLLKPFDVIFGLAEMLARDPLLFRSSRVAPARSASQHSRCREADERRG